MTVLAHPPVSVDGWEPRYARRAGRIAASEIRELLKLVDRPGIVSFAGGIPDPALLPLAEAQAAYQAVLTDPRWRVAGCNTQSARATCRSGSGSRATWAAWV